MCLSKRQGARFERAEEDSEMEICWKISEPFFPDPRSKQDGCWKDFDPAPFGLLLLLLLRRAWLGLPCRSRCSGSRNLQSAKWTSDLTAR